VWLKANSTEDELLVDPGYAEAMLSNVKSAWMVEEWTEEATIRDLESRLDVSPGDVHHRVDLMGWLLAGAQHVLMADDVFSDEHMHIISEIVQQISILQQRVRHGCKTDLLQLVNIRHVGRQRAREMASLGLRQPNDVATMSMKTKNSLLGLRGWGPMLLEKIVNEVERVLRKASSDSNQQPTIREDDVPLEGERFEDG
jgi:helicase